MNLKDMVRNKGRRFKTVEAEASGDVSHSRYVGILKSFFRGGTLTGLLTYVVSQGDIDSAVQASSIAGTLDTYILNPSQIKRLKKLYKNNQEEYRREKFNYENGGLFD